MLTQSHTPLGLRIDLPRHQSPHRLPAGLVALGFALLVSGFSFYFAYIWITGVLQIAQGGGTGPIIMAAVMAVFGLIPASMGVVVLITLGRFGLAFAFANSHILVTQSTIERRDVIPFIPFLPVVKRARLADARAIRVEPASGAADTEDEDNPAETTEAKLSDAPDAARAAALLARSGFGQYGAVTVALRPETIKNPDKPRFLPKDRVMIATGLEDDTLKDIARIIADRTGLPLETPDPAEEPNASSPGTPTQPVAPDLDSIEDPPDHSKAALTVDAGTLSIALPAPGFFKGTKGLGAFSVLWLAFTGVFTAVMLPAALTGNVTQSGGQQVSAYLIILFLIPFWLVGLGVLRYARSLASRRATLDVLGDSLIITETRLGTPRSISLTRDQIASIALGNGTMEVNDKPIKELHIELAEPMTRQQFRESPGSRRRSDTTLAIFAERDDDTLRWIIKSLRAALGLGTGSKRGPAPTPDSPPNASV